MRRPKIRKSGFHKLHETILKMDEIKRAQDERKRKSSIFQPKLDVDVYGGDNMDEYVREVIDDEDDGDDKILTSSGRNASITASKDLLDTGDHDNDVDINENNFLHNIMLYNFYQIHIYINLKFIYPFF